MEYKNNETTYVFKTLDGKGYARTTGFLRVRRRLNSVRSGRRGDSCVLVTSMYSNLHRTFFLTLSRKNI